MVHLEIIVHDLYTGQAAKRAALDDVVAASWATALYVAPQRVVGRLSYRDRAIRSAFLRAHAQKLPRVIRQKLEAVGWLGALHWRSGAASRGRWSSAPSA